MITKQKIQTIADTYDAKVVEVEILHDCNSVGCIADYIKLKLKDKNAEHGVNVYLGTEYPIVSNKEYYLECKIKNALHATL